jgi:hypothetical protein
MHGLEASRGIYRWKKFLAWLISRKESSRGLPDFTQLTTLQHVVSSAVSGRMNAWIRRIGDDLASRLPDRIREALTILGAGKIHNRCGPKAARCMGANRCQSSVYRGYLRSGGSVSEGFFSLNLP